MATAAQAAANLANAQLSTGPTSEAGKAASSRNALKHGLTARSILLPGEDEAAYRKLCDETFHYWKPANEQEKVLVQILCDTEWRIARCPSLEAAVISGEYPDYKALDALSKHEARLKKQYSAGLKEVRDLIAARIDREEARMKQAKIVRRVDIIRECESNLKALGFDFSIEQVDAAISRENAMDEANWAWYEHEHGSSGDYFDKYVRF